VGGGKDLKKSFKIVNIQLARTGIYKTGFLKFNRTACSSKDTSWLVRKLKWLSNFSR